MKKFFLGIILCVHTAAISQVSTYLTVNCFTVKQLAEVLTEFKEEPFAVGTVTRSNSNNEEESNVLLFVNPNTGSWTIAEKHKSGLYCVLTGGSGFNLIEKIKTL